MSVWKKLPSELLLEYKDLMKILWIYIQYKYFLVILVLLYKKESVSHS